jgi:hypothetical protein
VHGSYPTCHLPFHGLDQQISEIKTLQKISIQNTASAFAATPIITPHFNRLDVQRADTTAPKISQAFWNHCRQVLPGQNRRTGRWLYWHCHEHCPFLIERLPIEGMPATDQPWLVFQLWALKEFLWMVVLVTLLALAESIYRLIKLDGSAFFRPWALVVKMFAVVVVSNFGFATWTIIPLVAILQVPEDFITRWAPRMGEENPD